MGNMVIDKISSGGKTYEFADSTARGQISDLASRVSRLNDNQTEAISEEHDRAVLQEQALDNAKVDKEVGKSLTSNDFTDEYKDAIDNPVPFEGATSLLDGHAGNVPKPLAGDDGKYLKGDGTWDMIALNEESALSHTVNGNVITDVYGTGIIVTTTFNSSSSITEVYSKGGNTLFTLDTTIGADGSVTRTRTEGA